MSFTYSERSETMRDALTRTIASLTQPKVTLRALLAMFGDHGSLLLCALLSLPFILPVSIPGVSTVFGLAILLLGISITMNTIPWLPRQIMDRELDAQMLKNVLQRGLNTVIRVESILERRIDLLTAGKLAGRINGLAIVAGALLLMLPLGLVPFSNTLPALAVMFLCIGISQRDGLLVLAGYGMLVATVIYFTFLAWAAYQAGSGIISFFFSG
jgi:hypothetical protein